MTDPIQIITDLHDGYGRISVSPTSFGCDLVSTLDAAGWAIVPKEATVDMAMLGATKAETAVNARMPALAVDLAYREMVEAGRVKP